MAWNGSFDGDGSGVQGAGLILGTRFAMGSQLLRAFIQFGTLALLSRLLLPADFGRFSMVAVLVGFLWTIRDFGLGPAVVQKRDLTQGLLSSLHWAATGFALLCWLLLALGAKAAAAAFRDPAVAPLLQAAGLTIPLTALGSVQLALLERRMAFKALAIIEVGAALLGTGAALLAAVRGAGPWSLVIQALVGNAFQTAFLWLASSWRPVLSARLGEVKEVLGFSLPNAAAALLGYLMRNVDNFLIGRYLGAEQLGYYNLAYTLLLFPVQSVAGSVCRATLPALSRLRDQRDDFRALYLRSAGAIALLTFPLMLGLWVLLEPFVRVVFGARWMPALPVLMILVPLALIQSMGTTVGILYQAVGRTDMLFRWELWNSPLVVAGIAAGLPWGIRGVAIGYTLANLVTEYPGFAIPFRMVGLRMGSFLRVLWAPALCAGLMAMAVALVRLTWPGAVAGAVGLAGMTLLGVLGYGGLLWGFRRDEIQFLMRAVGWNR